MGGLNTTGKLVLAFVTLLLGAILVGQLATMEQPYTNVAQATNEAINLATVRNGGIDINTTKAVFTLANAYTGNDYWKTEYSVCDVDAVSYGNATTAWTETTDYTLSTAGVLSVKNTSTTALQTANATIVSYKYCPDDYMALSWGRSAMNICMGLFAIACFIASVGLFWSVGKETGIIQ